jgi:hypothetical protein
MQSSIEHTHPTVLDDISTPPVFLNHEDQRNLSALNACVHVMILGIPNLRNYLASDCPKEDVSKKKINARMVVNECMALASGATCDTRTLCVAMGKIYRSSLSKHKQHDPWVWFVSLVHALHDGLDKTNHIEGAPSSSSPWLHRDAWDAHNEKNGYSILVELFQAQLDSSRHPWHVSVPISPKPVAVSAAYDVAPLVMVIRIEKFDLTGKKIDAFVPYSTSLTIMERGNAVAYALHSVVLHKGSDLESGKCAALVQRSRQWYFVDDERVIDIKHIQDVVQREAYILVYIRCL